MGDAAILHSKAEHRSFRRPDATRSFPHGKAEILRIAGTEIGLMTLQPGWRWSNDVKPIAKTSSCMAGHFLYVVAGRLAVRMDDGTELTIGPDEVGVLPPGHDAWVAGTEPVVLVDWTGAGDYARPRL